MLKSTVNYVNHQQPGVTFWFGFPFGNPNPSPRFVSDDDDGMGWDKLKCAVRTCVL